MSPIERLIRRAGGPAFVGTVFDVGAYDGFHSLAAAERYPHVHFVAVEPTPQFAERLRQLASELRNYEVVEAAVSSAEGDRTFNVFHATPTLNSLNRLDTSAAPRLGLRSSEPDAQQLVPVKRLSTICDDLGIDTIDVLHIDTQGSDLDVLRSLDDDRLSRLRAGVIEVSFRVRLYDTSTSGPRVRASLSEVGFRVFRVERVHATADIEQNYFFDRRPRNVPNGERVVEAGFRVHHFASEARAAGMRCLVLPVNRLRGAAALRTRLKRLRNSTR